MQIFSVRTLRVFSFLSCLWTATAAPNVGEKAPDFRLSSTEGASMHLSTLITEAPVVLVVLRGFPGYQCPFCQRQLQDFVAKSEAFVKAGAKVVFVYPGPADKLNEHAGEFLSGKNFSSSFVMLLDPDYEFTNLYGLRWNSPRETAYPSTFVIDRQGTVMFSRVVRSHGARTTAAEVLEVLPKKKPL